jgi:hypothetical protein
MVRMNGFLRSMAEVICDSVIWARKLKGLKHPNLDGLPPNDEKVNRPCRELVKMQIVPLERSGVEPALLPTACRFPPIRAVTRGVAELRVRRMPRMRRRCEESPKLLRHPNAF